jgi:hypothetical protein
MEGEGLVKATIVLEFDSRAKRIAQRFGSVIYGPCLCGINRNWRPTTIDGVHYADFGYPMQVPPDDRRCAHRSITLSLLRAYRRGRQH